MTEKREGKVNWDKIEANWKELKGDAKSRWGRLTDDDLTEIDGKREQLLGKLQQHYGTAKEELERDVDKWGRWQASALDATRNGR